MRRAVAVAVGAWLVLVGCSTTIDGSAMVGQGFVVATEPATSDPATGPPRTTAPSESDAPASTGANTDADASRTSSSVLATSSAIPVEIPAGFAPYGYFGYRAVSSDATCPPDIPDCVGIDVYSVDDCPAGATVVLDYYKEETNPTTFLAEVTGTTPPITTGGTQSVFIGIPEQVVGEYPYGYIKTIAC